ncbi:MAG: OB-fold nucleic acid binding domain-containing protein, partial [Pseudanabaena sp.]
MPLDINRLQQALSIEAEKGFSNLQGKQFLFADFLNVSLQEIPEDWEMSDRLQANTLANQYAQYSDLTLSRRQHLVAETRRLLYEVRRREIAQTSAAPKTKKPKTEAIAATEPKATKKITPDTELKSVEGVGSFMATKFKLLDLHTVRDVLNYYPRDHIDYARQIPIRDLKDGDTVTVIGTIKRFGCFTSPKNTNLTIVEIILRDYTGQIKLSRFWTGKRYANRGWQESQKKLYPQGCTVAASGVVKQSKYGLTLENYEVEVLEHTQDTIQSKTVGRVVPVYPLTEGISPEAIRRLVAQCLPAASQIHDPMPDRFLNDYKMMRLPDAIAQVHYPDTSETLEQAVIRLTFDKYFYRRLVSL